MVRTEVNKAISRALAAADIEIPYSTYDVNLAYKDEASQKNDNES